MRETGEEEKKKKKKNEKKIFFLSLLQTFAENDAKTNNDGSRPGIAILPPPYPLQLPAQLAFLSLFIGQIPGPANHGRDVYYDSGGFGIHSRPVTVLALHTRSLLTAGDYSALRNFHHFILWLLLH